MRLYDLKSDIQIAKGDRAGARKTLEKALQIARALPVEQRRRSAGRVDREKAEVGAVMPPRAAVIGAVFARVHAWVAKIPRAASRPMGSFRTRRRQSQPVGVGWALRASGPGLPWHRVVNAQGGLSTESEEPGRQRALLAAEGVKFGPDGKIDLARHQWRPRVRNRRGLVTSAAARLCRGITAAGCDRFRALRRTTTAAGPTPAACSRRRACGDDRSRRRLGATSSAGIGAGAADVARQRSQGALARTLHKRAQMWRASIGARSQRRLSDLKLLRSDGARPQPERASNDDEPTHGSSQESLRLRKCRSRLARARSAGGRSDSRQAARSSGVVAMRGNGKARPASTLQARGPPAAFRQLA